MSCRLCKKRCKNFCYVHKKHVCDSCLIQPQIKSKAEICTTQCVIDSWENWITNAEYDWPSRCSICNHTITANLNDNIRLSCLCVLHRQCLMEHVKKTVTSIMPKNPPLSFPLNSSQITPFEQQTLKCTHCMNNILCPQNTDLLQLNVKDFVQQCCYSRDPLSVAASSTSSSSTTSSTGLLSTIGWKGLTSRATKTAHIEEKMSPAKGLIDIESGKVGGMNIVSDDFGHTGSKKQDDDYLDNDDNDKKRRSPGSRGNNVLLVILGTVIVILLLLFSGNSTAVALLAPFYRG